MSNNQLDKINEVLQQFVKMSSQIQTLDNTIIPIEIGAKQEPIVFNEKVITYENWPELFYWAKYFRELNNITINELLMFLNVEYRSSYIQHLTNPDTDYIPSFRKDTTGKVLWDALILGYNTYKLDDIAQLKIHDIRMESFINRVSHFTEEYCYVNELLKMGTSICIQKVEDNTIYIIISLNIDFAEKKTAIVADLKEFLTNKLKRAIELVVSNTNLIIQC